MRREARDPITSYPKALSLLREAPLPPDQKVGSLVIDTFEISADEAKLYNMRLAFAGAGSYSRYVEPGIYRRLSVGRTLWMSNTRAEVLDHVEPVRRAHGRVLITGLGLGLVASAILQKEEVGRVTIIENDPQVLATVGLWISKYYGVDRVEVIPADAFEWKMPKYCRWDVAWHDIWPDICSDNLASMGRLKRKFAQRIEDWQGCWGQEQARRQARRDRY